MNLYCPNCQKPLQVPDQLAGEQVKCPHCATLFPAPALPSLPGQALPPPPLLPQPKEDVYGMNPPVVPPTSGWASAPVTAPAPPRPATSTPTAPLPPPAPPAPPPPSPADAAPSTAGYTRTSTLWISPRVTPFVAPVALAVVFLLTFFSWTGSYPGGIGVYTQTAWQGLYGGFSTDPVGKKVFDKEKDIQSAIGLNVFTLLYLLALLPAVVVAVGAVVAIRGNVQLPPVVQQFLPWRTLIVAGLAGLLLLLLIVMLVLGLGLETATVAVVDKAIAKESDNATTDEDREKVAILRGVTLGEYNLHRTIWLRLAVYAQIAAAIGAGLDLWLHLRGTKPLPKIEFQR